MRRTLICAAAVALLAACSTTPISIASECVPISTWIDPGTKQGIAADAVIARAAQQSVALLGEHHDKLEHHRWQLRTAEALHALRPDMILAFEMFPRRVQPALDRWVGGEIDEAEFLAASDWRKVWRFDPELYLPLFRFARERRVPMLALNVDISLIRAVSARGLDAVAADEREGVDTPAAPDAEYVEQLREIYAKHGRGSGLPAPDDARFVRFLDGQQVWDRAMAQRIAAALMRSPQSLVVGIMGSGHVANGYGVPHQLRDLGITRIAALLPWDKDSDCARLAPGLADAVYGVEAQSAP